MPRISGFELDVFELLDRLHLILLPYRSRLRRCLTDEQTDSALFVGDHSTDNTWNLPFVISGMPLDWHVMRRLDKSMRLISHLLWVERVSLPCVSLNARAAARKDCGTMHNLLQKASSQDIVDALDIWYLPRHP